MERAPIVIGNYFMHDSKYREGYGLPFLNNATVIFVLL